MRGDAVWRLSDPLDPRISSSVGPHTLDAVKVDNE